MKERIFIAKAKEEVNMQEFIRKHFSTAKVGDIEIQKTPIMTRIVLHTTTPGLIIGSGGEKIREITDMLRDKFKIDNPQIDVQKIDDANLDAAIVAKSLASQIESGVNYRRLGNFYLEKIMRSGAVGCEIVMSGKLSGERSRRDRFVAGYVKKSGELAKQHVRKGFAVANPKLGNIGVSVQIMVDYPQSIANSVRKITEPVPKAEEAEPAKPEAAEEGKRE
ncbi:MAG: 30S ribosomal protein S3 [Candidatus Aenigmarchaeota archaeon]|nr:30S ribosomal protein S3 [Candidatus Aenigmarchaeota archaeon]